MQYDGMRQMWGDDAISHALARFFSEPDQWIPKSILVLSAIVVAQKTRKYWLLAIVAILFVASLMPFTTLTARWTSELLERDISSDVQAEKAQIRQSNVSQSDYFSRRLHRWDPDDGLSLLFVNHGPLRMSIDNLVVSIVGVVLIGTMLYGVDRRKNPATVRQTAPIALLFVEFLGCSVASSVGSLPMGYWLIVGVSLCLMLMIQVSQPGDRCSLALGIIGILGCVVIAFFAEYRLTVYWRAEQSLSRWATSLPADRATWADVFLTNIRVLKSVAQYMNAALIASSLSIVFGVVYVIKRSRTSLPQVVHPAPGSIARTDPNNQNADAGAQEAKPLSK